MLGMQEKLPIDKRENTNTAKQVICVYKITNLYKVKHKNY